MDILALIEAMRLLKEDHEPNGWPCVQMHEITALVDEIERLQAITKAAWGTQQRIDELEQWIASIADNHPQIPDWIQQSARSLLAKEKIDAKVK